MRRNLKLGMLSLMSFMLFACAAKVEVAFKQKQYDSYGDKPLYAEFKKTIDGYEISNITNSNETNFSNNWKGIDFGKLLMKLNNLRPGMSTENQWCSRSSCKDDYPKFRKLSKNSNDDSEYLNFQFDKYYEAAESAASKIDRKKIVEKYDDAVSQIEKMQLDYLETEKYVNDQYANLYVKYHGIYEMNYNKLKIKTEINDRSGFLNKTIDLTQHFYLSKNNLIFNKKMESAIHNKDFTSSISEFDNNINKYINNSKDFYINSKTKAMTSIAEFEKQLINQPSIANIVTTKIYQLYNYDYKFDYNKNIDISTNNSNPELVILNIYSKSFSNVYPEASLNDSNIKLNFNGQNITLINKTKNFLQIKSLAAYYNNKIVNYEMVNEIELPPESTISDISIDKFVSKNIILETNYPKMTATIAKKTKINFGFAVKYHVVEQNIDKTLYKTADYNLYDVLKRI